MRTIRRTNRTRAPLSNTSARRGVPRWAARVGRWGWAHHPGLWLALGLGAGLRLWHIDVTQFLYDQAGLMTLARGAVVRHALPVTGIGSSVHTYNPPLSIYLLIPFVALGKDPLLAAISVALWNIAGIAFCYLFALRFFGRGAATISALLLAASGKAVIYSRFIWQQNYLPPLLVLWAFTLYAGCVHGRRGWLAPNLILLALIAALHPTGLLVAPLVLVAILVGPLRPRLREYMLGAGIIVVLFTPTIIWEVVSRGADLDALRRLGDRPAHFDLDSIAMLHELLGGPAFPFANVGHTYAIAAPGSAYAALGGLHQALALAVALLYGASYLILTALVAAPVRAVWPAQGPSAGTRHRLAAGLAAIARGLRADPTWRGHLLLWLWVTLPPLAMIRHTTPVYVHYLLVLYPAVFMMAGRAAQWALAVSATGTAPSRVLSRMRVGFGRGAAALKPQGGAGSQRAAYQALVVALAALVVTGQATQSALFIGAQASGQVDNTYYGYPLSQLRAADTRLAALQRQQGATSIYIGTQRSYYSGALRYLLVTEEAGRVGIYGSCLVLPAPGARPALVVTTAPGGPEHALLAALPAARRVATLPMPGSQPFTVYRVTAAAPPLVPDETPLGPVVFRAGENAALRLEAEAQDGPDTLRLRWTVLASSPAAAASQWYGVQAHALDASGRAGQLLAQGACDATRWRVGETLFTWLRTRTPSASQSTVAAYASLAAQPLVLDLQSRSDALFAPNLGPVRLLSSRLDGTPLATLSPSLAAPTGAAPGAGTLTSAGAFVVPARALSELPAAP